MPSPPTLFPTYLVPPLPFRRRLSSVDSTASSTASSSAPSVDSAGYGSPPPNGSYLAGHASHLRCARCLSDLALSHQIISKGFTGRHGRAYLVAAPPSAGATHEPPARTVPAKHDALPNLPNTYTHKPVPRQLVTGAHTVGDVSCAHCGSVLGWKYVAAAEEAQRYKVGKFILETKRVCRASTWETDDDDDDGPSGDGHNTRAVYSRRRRSATVAPPTDMPAVPEDEVEFDSQDDDECEDLFLGVWTPQLAAKRRRAKRLDPAGRP